MLKCEVEVILRRSPRSDKDCVDVSIWSGQAASGMRSVFGRLSPCRQLKRGLTARAEIYYAGSCVGSLEIAKGGGFARLLLVHTGPHLDITAFSIQTPELCPIDRARIFIA